MIITIFTVRGFILWLYSQECLKKGTVFFVLFQQWTLAVPMVTYLDFSASGNIFANFEAKVKSYLQCEGWFQGQKITRDSEFVHQTRKSVSKAVV